jgi:polyferredoxin
MGKNLKGRGFSATMWGWLGVSSLIALVAGLVERRWWCGVFLVPAGSRWADERLESG